MVRRFLSVPNETTTTTNKKVNNNNEKRKERVQSALVLNWIRTGAVRRRCLFLFGALQRTLSRLRLRRRRFLFVVGTR